MKPYRAVSELARRPQSVEQSGRSVAPRVHAEIDMGLDGGVGGATREQLWEGLSPKLRQRMTEIAGETLCWWATLNDGTGATEATILGTKALVYSKPERRPGPGGNLITRHTLPGFQFAPGSLRRMLLTTGIELPRAGEITDGRSRSGPAQQGPLYDIGLSADSSGRLGSLPAEVQRILQRPFSDRDERPDFFHYRYGNSDHVDDYIVILASRSAVTFAYGSADPAADGSWSNGDWSLTCGGAVVTRQMA